MKTNHKILILFVLIVAMLSGCTLTRIVTNTPDEKGRVKVTKKTELSKNIPVLQGLGILAVAILMGKSKNGVAAATALLTYDLSYKTYKFRREMAEKGNLEILKEKN